MYAICPNTLPCSCNKATGEPTSICWVDKPDGAACRPELYGDQAVPAFPVTHVCRSGDCVEKPGEGRSLHRSDLVHDAEVYSCQTGRSAVGGGKLTSSDGRV
jgi:hypothetical protein